MNVGAGLVPGRAGQVHDEALFLSRRCAIHVGDKNIRRGDLAGVRGAVGRGCHVYIKNISDS